MLHRKLNTSVPLLLFLITSLFVIYSIHLEENTQVILGKILSVVFVALYYCFSVSKIDKLFIISLFFSLLGGVIYNIDSSSAYVLVTVFFARFLILLTTIQDFKRIDKKLFIKVLFMMIFCATLVLSLLFRKEIYFYFVICVAILTVFLISMLYMKTLKTIKKGNIEMFSAIAICMFVDAVFSIQNMSIPKVLGIIIVSSVYHMCYYLMCVSMIKKDIFLRENK